MSEALSSPGSFYQAGGTLRPGTPSYIVRQADAELYQHLLAGDYCYVLTARQMGKSSLMAKTAKRLEGEGVRAAIVDLTQIGTERGSAEANQWYFGVAHEIHRRLGISEPLRPWWQERADLPALQRLTEFFREMVLAHCSGKVVVFIDEIDSTIGLSFADDFFATIRACYNSRATEPSFERLTFVLLGVASPDQLIQNSTRTPFNIGHRIDLADFSLEEAGSLAGGLHQDPGLAAQRLERVFHWTGGHPYLTQALCRAVKDGADDSASSEALVDPSVDALFLSASAQREETNLKYARARLTPEGAEGRRLLRLYRKVLRGQDVEDEPTSSLFSQLKLSGVVKVSSRGRLEVRNRIYAAVFNLDWLKSEIPAINRARQRRVIGVAVATALLLLFGYGAAILHKWIYTQRIQAATGSDAFPLAAQAYSRLRANPLSRLRADDLMAEYWDRRALRYAKLGQRDEALLSWLKAIEVKDDSARRKKVQELVGKDYVELEGTFRSPDEISALTFSQDGSEILATSPHGSVTAWDRKSSKPVRRTGSARREVRPSDRYSIDLHADGSFTFTPSRVGYRQLGPKACQFIKNVYPKARRGDPCSLLYVGIESSGCAAVLVCGVEKKEITLQPLATAFSPDGEVFAVGANAVRVWSVQSQKPIGASIQLRGTVDLAFTRDGRKLITGDRVGHVRFWNWGSGKPEGPLLLHGAGIHALAMGPGDLLVTGGADRTVRLWRHKGGLPQDLSLQQGSSKDLLVYWQKVLALQFDKKTGAFVPL